MRHGIVAAIAFSLALIAPGFASADPPARDIFEGTDFEIEGVCSFPVRIERTGKVVRRTWIDNDGSVRQHFTRKHATLTITNLDTGAQYVVRGYGGHQERTTPADGSPPTSRGSGKVLWGQAHPITGDPGYFLITGHTVSTFGDDGFVDTFRLVGGNILPLCPLVA